VRQVVPHALDLGGDDRKIVEQPFRGGAQELAAVSVPQKRPIGAAELAGVVLEAREEAAPSAAGRGIDREAGRERLGLLLQSFDAQQLTAKGRLWRFTASGADEERSTLLLRWRTVVDREPATANVGAPDGSAGIPTRRFSCGRRHRWR
jgi:hypothetical protein